MNTVNQAFVDLRNRLIDAGIDGAETDARYLVSHALGIKPSRLTLYLRDEMAKDTGERLARFAERRILDRVPVSHITQSRSFMGHDFTVTPDVLDPRPDTEALVLEALKVPFQSVLDLGTGSGAILLSLLADMPDAQGLGTDISPDALKIAKKNADTLDLGQRAQFVQSDWYANVTGSAFDLVVSNPPYIAQSEMRDLSAEVLNEPHIALTDFGDGLSAYRRIVDGIAQVLLPGGRLIVEIGLTQATPVHEIFDTAGLTKIKVLQDLDGRDRVVSAHRRSR